MCGVLCCVRVHYMYNAPSSGTKLVTRAFAGSFSELVPTVGIAPLASVLGQEWNS